MGFHPRQVDGMSFEEFDACVEGCNRNNGGGNTSPHDISDEQYEDDGRLLDEVIRSASLRSPDGN